jgi:uroporphyrin-III C-methyltransferase
MFYFFLRRQGSAAMRRAWSEGGVVALVGAGPGDPGLLTLRARDRLATAEVVVHDRLVGQEILALIGPRALAIDVGKTPYGPSWSQDAINALLIRHGRAGARVVRLKAGDPGVFGRLEEEIDALEAAGVAWEVTPGVTAAAAAAADAGIALTRRGRNAGLRVITAHDARGFADLDWAGLARPGETAAVYMGVRASGRIAERLIAAGADPETPVTVVENASRPERSVLAARLGDLAERIDAAGVRGPAVLLLGLRARAASVDASPRAASMVELALTAGF